LPSWRWLVHQKGVGLHVLVHLELRLLVEAKRAAPKRRSPIAYHIGAISIHTLTSQVPDQL
jgi:hypothetical protein